MAATMALSWVSSHASVIFSFKLASVVFSFKLASVIFSFKLASVIFSFKLASVIFSCLLQLQACINILYEHTSVNFSCGIQLIKPAQTMPSSPSIYLGHLQLQARIDTLFRLTLMASFSFPIHLNRAVLALIIAAKTG
jgi:hypothetical protein